MTYKEKYLACNSEEEILEKVKHDIEIAMFVGSNDRVKIIKQHAEERKGMDFRSAEGKSNSISSAREARTRKDVTTEKVIELKNKGLTITEIANELHCGINTINRRLGMKDY